MTFTIENQKFGFELEFSGISRYKAVQVISQVLNGRVSGSFVYDQQGRDWEVTLDGSVNRINGGDNLELVSPPLTYADMDTVQEVVRQLRKAGAKVDKSCGMHVHVDLANYTAKSLKNLVKYYAKYENMFYKASQVLPNRAVRYAQRLTEKHPNLVAQIDSVKTLDDLKILWYGYNKTSFRKYDDSRYAGLNLHNIWYKGWMSGTVEFRLFNSTLHAGEVRTFITLALAISAKALNAKTVNSRQNSIVPDEFLFPKILGGLGITAGNETTKNVYKHLTKSMRTA